MKKLDLGWQKSETGRGMIRAREFVDHNGTLVPVSASTRTAASVPGFIGTVSIAGEMIHMSEHGSMREATRACDSAFSRARELRTLPGQRDVEDDEDDDEADESEN
jgi:hypothetical protein